MRVTALSDVRSAPAAAGRSRRFGFEIERRLCEPLPTKPLEAAKRRYVPIADARD